MKALFRNTIYVRIEAERLSLFHAESGRQIEDRPVVAIEEKNGKHTIIGVGRESEQHRGVAGIELVNGFSHPRTLIADFTIAEQTLKRFLQRLSPRSLFAPAPVLILQPLEKLEGDLTPIEVRAFVELALGAGARKVFVWTGGALSREMLQARRFSENEGKLHYPQA
jgi:rod shape-determining protein MreB and related proteins